MDKGTCVGFPRPGGINGLNQKLEFQHVFYIISHQYGRQQCSTRILEIFGNMFVYTFTP